MKKGFIIEELADSSFQVSVINLIKENNRLIPQCVYTNIYLHEWQARLDLIRQIA